MTTIFRIALLAVVVYAVAEAPCAQDEIEIIRFQSATFPGNVFTNFMPAVDEGEPVTVFGILRMPVRVDRVPAVILTHGCGGITGTEADWARELKEIGVATFLINSFAGRDITQICTGQPSMNVASALADVYSALALMASDPRIDASRIALMGFSFGGRTALWANHLRFQERYSRGTSRFAAYLAFYPPCYINLAEEDRITDSTARIFHGTADDWTPIAPCREYVKRLRNAGKDIAMFEYPAARHGFDNRLSPAYQALPGVANLGRCAFVERQGKLVDAIGRPTGFDASCVIREASIGYNARAHKQAFTDVQDFLVTHFRLK